MPLETPKDLATFFDTDDFADECVITGPEPDEESEDEQFTRTLNVILNTETEAVTLYETNVESPSPSFLCREVDLMTAGVVDVRRGYGATVRGKAFTIERIAMDQAGTATVFLSDGVWR